MKNFIDLAIFIKKNTPYNVVIRPHPEESLEPYCKKFNDLDGIFVDQKGSVVPAILASRQWFITTVPPLLSAQCLAEILLHTFQC